MNSPGTPPTPPLDRDTILIALAALVVVIGGAVILLLSERDLTPYLVVLGGPLVSGLVGFILSKRVAAVKLTAEDNNRQLEIVKVATDGILSAKLAGLSGQLESAAVHREDIAHDQAAATDAANRRPSEQ